MNAPPVSARALWQRAALVQSLRRFFIDRGYLEVDTPLRIPAPAPEAHIEPEPSGGWFLQTSPELCMKQLLVAGFPKIFQLCKCFRRTERGSRHLPEFTMLEWYRADTDYRGLMRECEELVRFLAAGLGCGQSIPAVTGAVALEGDWERLSVADAFRRYAPVTALEALQQHAFDELLVTHVEPRLGMARPTFLYDYPVQLGSLARVKPGDPSVAERFELYIGGVELANGFSELTDVVEQRHRFEKDQQMIRASGRTPAPLPEKFLAALPRMPEAAGIALGVDRLAMLFAGVETIDAVVPFTPEEL